MKRELYGKLKDHPARDVLKRAAHGRMPTSDEFLVAAGDDAEKAGMLERTAQKLDEKRRRNEGMRGRVDAIRLADEAAAGYVALHDPPAPVERLSAEEEAEAVGVAERIKSRPENRFTL